MTDGVLHHHHRRRRQRLRQHTIIATFATAPFATIVAANLALPPFLPSHAFSTATFTTAALTSFSSTTAAC